jgi:acyl-CoA thioesterase
MQRLKVWENKKMVFGGVVVSKSLLPDQNCIHIRKEKVKLWNEV